jgi:diguanylate cyclase (GGDEF)-like protein
MTHTYSLSGSETEQIELEDAPATASQRSTAVTICALLALIALFAALLGSEQGPSMSSLVLITGIIWSLADMLTAFLLLAQFRVKGSLLFGFLAAAYGLSAILTWPYLAVFPGLFPTDGATQSDQQISLALWTIWHLTFPLLALGGLGLESLVSRIVSPLKIGIATAAVASLTVVSAVGITVAVFIYRTALPHLVIAGRFQPLMRFGIIPVVAVLTVGAGLLLLRRRPSTSLSMWLAVAMFSATIDLLLNSIGIARYSYAWDVGKLITVATASIVLVMMLADIAGLYARLTRLVRTDALTALPNRRAFEEHLHLLFQNARRQRGSLALLIVDIDFFKRYNDTYGHLAGDECLRRVARELAACVHRPLDLVARFGGEEFVVALPDTPPAGVLTVAERIRAAIACLEIDHQPQPGRVTVSVGAGYVPDELEVNASELFETADRALYVAKEGGRNRVMFAALPAALTAETVLAPAEVVAHSPSEVVASARADVIAPAMIEAAAAGS